MTPIQGWVNMAGMVGQYQRNMQSSLSTKTIVAGRTSEASAQLDIGLCPVCTRGTMLIQLPADQALPIRGDPLSIIYGYLPTIQSPYSK